jgi:hypothetical protein
VRLDVFIFSGMDAPLLLKLYFIKKRGSLRVALNPNFAAGSASEMSL